MEASAPSQAPLVCPGHSRGVVQLSYRFFSSLLSLNVLSCSSTKRVATHSRTWRRAAGWKAQLLLYSRCFSSAQSAFSRADYRLQKGKRASKRGRSGCGDELDCVAED
eukprot:2027268-Rhodomonas_salina.2